MLEVLVGIFVLILLRFVWKRNQGFPKLVYVYKENCKPEHLQVLDDETHNSMRAQGDDIADNIVGWLESSDDDAVRLRESIQTDDLLKLIEVGETLGYAPCVEFMRNIREVPSWMDKEKIAAGQRAFKKNALPNLVVLLVALVTSYLAEKGSQVLICTGRLKDDTNKRIEETAFMLVQLYFNELKPGSPAHRALIQVRLLHARVRSFIKRAVKWDAQKLGFPINQEDLLGTMILFSSVMVEGTESLGVKVSQEDKEAVNHLWQCAGYYLGIKKQYLPKTFEEETRIRVFIAATQLSMNSKTGQKLASYLLDNAPEPAASRAILRFISPSVSDIANLSKEIPFRAQIRVELICFISWCISEAQIYFPVTQYFVVKTSKLLALGFIMFSTKKTPLKEYSFPFSIKRGVSHPKIQPMKPLVSM